MVDEDFRTQVFNNLNLLETDDLIEIWQNNNHVEWSDTAFEVVQQILRTRLGQIPLQDTPIYKISKQDTEIEKEIIEKEIIKGVWKHFLYTLPILFGFMTFAISLSLGCFIAGFSGVIVAIKKEAPSGRGTVRGTWAVVSGVLTTIFFWSLAAYFFWVEVSIKWWGF